MPGTRTRKASFRWVGRALLLAGTAVGVVQFGSAALWAQSIASSSASDSLGPYGAVGLASLHLLQATMFDQCAWVPLMWKILVSFTATAMIVAGLAVLRSGAAKVTVTLAPMFVQRDAHE